MISLLSNPNKRIEPSFPNINEYLCPKEMTSLSEADKKYQLTLRETRMLYNIEYANKLAEYQNLYNIENFIPIKKDFHKLISYLGKWKKIKGYNFDIVFNKRKKGYIKFNKKIRLFIENSLNAETKDEQKKYSLNKICDLIGLRLILLLGNEDTIDSIKLCYEVLEATYDFFINCNKGYFANNSEPLVHQGVNAKKHLNIVVPSDDEIKIPELLTNKVKDYYKYPKDNGYQSLHISFGSSQLGLPFEIQIRTMATHTRVEYETAMHIEHDKKRYKTPLLLDRKNVNIIGYRFINGFIEDFVGLEKSVNPFEIIY